MSATNSNPDRKAGLIKSIGLVSVLSAIFFSANYGIVRHVEVDLSTDSNNSALTTTATNSSVIVSTEDATTNQRQTKKKQKQQHARTGANHVDVKTVRRKNSNNKAASSTSSFRRKTNQEAPYHKNAVLIVHYHKTGYVLSRELMFLLHQLEHNVYNPELDDGRRGSNFQVSGIDPDNNGIRYAFDGIGNWMKSAFSTRKHDSETRCPNPTTVRPGQEGVLPETNGFTLRDGTMYVQESPDLFCSDDDLLEGLAKSHSGGTKIIHFVRNPYEMVLSNYFYHSQDPTPEKWVHKDNPCQHNYGDGKSLSSHIIPTLAQEFNNTSVHQLHEQFNAIHTMCHDIFQSKKKLKDATFFEHLLQLDKYDGLRLATAQMIAASGVSNGRMAGGDVLRMANNLIRFKRLQAASTPQNKIEVYTVTMGDFIKNMSKGTYDFFNFILGQEDTTIPKHILWQASVEQEEKYARKKKRKHVTQTNEEDQKIKSGLQERLRADSDLSFILNMTESLVYEALSL